MLTNEVSHILFINPCQSLELDDINPPLAGLKFRDVGLRPFQETGDILLLKPRRFPRPLKPRDQSFMFP